MTTKIVLFAEAQIPALSKESINADMKPNKKIRNDIRKRGRGKEKQKEKKIY